MVGIHGHFQALAKQPRISLQESNHKYWLGIANGVNVSEEKKRDYLAVVCFFGQVGGYFFCQRKFRASVWVTEDMDLVMHFHQIVGFSGKIVT